MAEPQTPASAPRDDGKYRANGRLVQDRAGKLFQLHSRQGLIRLQDAAKVIPPSKNAPCVDAACVDGAQVYVGITGVTDGGAPVGVPINDIAFDPDDENVVYVVPVWVAPGAPGSPEPYKAAARLRLDSTLTPPYRVERLYGSAPYLGDGCCTTTSCASSPCDVHHLREVEVDRFGTLFVVSTDVQNEDNSWLLVYDKNTGVRVGCTMKAGCPLPSRPVAVTVSSDGNDLYFGTSPEDADEYAAPLYRASIRRSEGAVSLGPPQITTLRNLRHITAIVEEPTSKQLWVVGFSAPSYAVFDEVPIHAGLFTDPRMAIVPPNATEAWGSSIGCHGFALPFSAIRVGSLCSGTGDADSDGDVDAVDTEQFVHCLGGPNAPPSDPDCLPQGPRSADLDCNGRVDLEDFARLQCRFTGNVRR